MTYNKAIAFIVPQLLPFLLKVRQEPRDQSDKGHIATYVINRLYAIPISHIPQHSRCNPRYPKGKTEKDRRSDLIYTVIIPVHTLE